MKINRFLVLVKRKLHSYGVKAVCVGEEEAAAVAKKIIDLDHEELVVPIFDGENMEYLFFSEKVGTSKKKRRFR